MNKLLCPSMMCVDYDALKEKVIELDRAGIDIFHCDIMDGMFVPNITMGTLDVKAIKKNTNKLVDVHLMIENPLNKIDLFIDAGADLIYVHPESERYTIKTLQYIINRNRLAGIAINPDTTVETVYEMLNLVSYILVMSVTPGYAGQQFLEFTVDKIKKLVDLKKQFTYKIIVDGGITPEKIDELSAIGVDGFILGTSVLFNQTKDYQEIIKEIRGL